MTAPRGYGGGYRVPDLSAECYVIIGGKRCGRAADHAGEHVTRVTFEHASEHAARMKARDMRKSDSWQDVRRVARTVTAERVCTDCAAPISTDAELMAHWAGRHNLAVLA